MLTWPIIRRGLAYLLSGKLRLKKSHIPPTNHKIPHQFIGVCVASATDATVDDYVIAQLNHLQIKEVRLDFTYGDLESFNLRFLQRLIAEKMNVTLHLIQPFHHAKEMENIAEQERWQSFLNEVLKRFGKQVKRVEIGSTINRKRWAGYTLNGFFAAWEIAFNACKQRGISIAGPNITDFELIYNIGILDILKAKNQLPDVHTNNLFSERISEPERFDHKVFKYRWATLFKFNLIKKARLLRKISADFNVKYLISPVAFWAIYRIQRLLPDGEQKQADYAARYMLLNAASGALDQTFWGAFICHREGLINDGLSDHEYPALERVTHYASVDGALENFRHHASFYALRTVAQLIQGAHYQSALSTANGLEIHHFQTATHDVHALWTINGKAALLKNIYDVADIAGAEIIHRDGQPLGFAPEIVNESPIYILWPKNRLISIKPEANLVKDLAIHAHIKEMQYYPFRQQEWLGLILARSFEEANLICQRLHPALLVDPKKSKNTGSDTLRYSRNAIWTLADPRNENAKITVKQPVKMHVHKQYLDRFKPSKAKRSWNGAMELLRRGVNTAQPVAFFEKENDRTLKQNFYLCDYVPTDCTVGEMFIHFANGQNEFYFSNQKVSISAEEVYAQLAQFLHRMHGSGTFFRDLSGGNILVQLLDDNKLNFSLIDTARARFYNHPTPMNQRYSDLTRICNKLHWQGRERLMELYLAGTGRKFNLSAKFNFYLYDFKVDFKRKFGRKGVRNLFRFFKKKLHRNVA